MQKGYLFIWNSTKPSKEDYLSSEEHKINFFALAPIEAANNLGYKLYMGINKKFPEKQSCKEFDITFYNQCCYRSLFALKDNINAYKNLDAFLYEHPDIEVIHCNTPIGGFLGRLLGRKHKIKTVIYTAHGFHFYKGAPLFNRTIIKWVEMYLARFTDVLLTMNQEDYESGLRLKLRGNGCVYKVPGVGVDTAKFEKTNVDRIEKRHSIGVPEDACVAIAMGDVVKRKNYKTAIKAIALARNPKIHYLICGVGDQIESLKGYCKSLGIEKQIHFLGFRTDVADLLTIADFFLFASLQEGLPRSTMEAMCAGLPCVVSRIRGHVDLIGDATGGYLVNAKDANGFADAIMKIYNNKSYAIKMGYTNKKRIKDYDISVVKNRIMEIYLKELC